MVSQPRNRTAKRTEITVESNKALEKLRTQPLHGILIHTNVHTVAAALDYTVVNVDTQKPS